jgi:hypothetical protein
MNLVVDVILACRDDFFLYREDKEVDEKKMHIEERERRKERCVHSLVIPVSY